MIPMLSIILPIYNVQAYLKKCLDSFSKYLPDDFEVILVDDGSTDQSLEIAKKYSEKFNNFRLFSKKNEGVSIARNYGLKKANGEWVWFIDSDDIISPSTLHLIRNILKSSNPDIFLFKYFCFKKKIYFPKTSNSCKKISKNAAMNTLLQDDYSTFVWNKVFRKNLFKNIQFPIDKNYTEDLEVSYKLYDAAKIFYLSTDKLYGYRQNTDSISHNVNDKYIKDAAITRYDMLRFFENSAYSIDIEKLRKETIISIISCLHRINKHDVYYGKFKRFICKEHLKENTLGFRYFLEIASFKYFRPLFFLIGKAGKEYRKFKCR